MTVISRLRRKHMASQQPADTLADPRPGLARPSSHSHDPDRTDIDVLKQPKRAHTFHDGAQPDDTSSTPEADTFESGQHSDEEEPELSRASIDLDLLPIELITLTDNFVESLSAKVHPKPPNIQKLSQMFHNFYALASSNINTHINALAARHGHDVSTIPSPSPKASTASRLRSKAASIGSKDKPKSGIEQQMITSEELTSRKKARKALEAKRSLIEEAVERRLCEGIYDRIYRHRSTQDEAQDEKLRSKTAALALVGIGPADLGVLLGDDTQQDETTTTEKTNEIREQLEPARREIIRMSESRYPLGKLNRLKAAHKSIVDTLARFHPSASADEIMPMLIYTLITLPPENLHVISDLNFIQSFRWDIKLNGEAAYCLTNLEAAISFLETVDLATLRADEFPSGPAKAAQQGSSKTFPPAYPGVTAPETTAAANTDNATAPTPEASSTLLKPEAVSANRRLSDLVNTPAQAIGAASDAVFSTADQGLKTISNSLGESYSFLIGKLKERQEGPKESLVVPKTLDDARKLMSTPPLEQDDATGEDVEQPKVPKREDRSLSLIGGRRDHSADSTRSGRSASSSKRVLFAADDQKGAAATTSTSQQSPAMLEQMRSLGTSLNPMTRLSNLGIRGFGRSTVTTTPPPSVKDVKEAKKDAKPIDGGDLTTAFPDLAAVLPLREAYKIAPPVQRFMEIQDVGDMKMSEVPLLLREYHRLVEALKKLDAFEEG